MGASKEEIMQSIDRSAFIRAVLFGGAAAGILDAVDAIVAFKAVLGLSPMPIYQFVASGMLGPSAFSGGIATMLVGVGVHFLIAFTAAATFVLASARLPWMTRNPAASGALFGVGVFAVMNYVVIPASLIPPSPFSLPLFVNGVLGHAILVGMPIAYAARYFLGEPRLGGQGYGAGAVKAQS
jgi:hypothetical protein